MRRLGTLLATAMLLAACTTAGTAPETGTSPSPAASTVTPSAAVTSEETTTPEVDRDADLATAQKLVDAWQDADLPLGEVRDNTDNQCPEDLSMGCTALITTDYVSVRVFADPTDAADWAGPGREVHVIGRVNASFGGASDFWPFDIGPYVAVMDDTLEDGGTT